MSPHMLLMMIVTGIPLTALAFAVAFLCAAGRHPLHSRMRIITVNAQPQPQSEDTDTWT
jgi:hypothetical protein